MAAMLSDDLVWHAAGRNLLSGDHVGKAAVFAMWGRMAAMMADGASMDQKIHAILADDDHAVALVETTGAYKGRTMSAQQFLTLHFAEGKITEGWVSFHDPYSVDQFWA